MPYLFLLLALSLFPIASGAQENHADHPTGRLAEAFYSWVLTNADTSLPNPEQMQTLGPMLAPELVDLIESARKLEAHCINMTPPGDKPPLFEGSLLAGNYEGATEVILQEPYVEGGQARVVAQLFYVDPHFPKAHRYRVSTWDDQLQLARYEAGWRIADIRFTNRPSLMLILVDYLAENQSCGENRQ